MIAAGWVCENGSWSRSVGPWAMSLEVDQSPSGYVWAAHLKHSGRFASRSEGLGKVGFARVEDVQGAADARLAAATSDLFKLAEVSK